MLSASARSRSRFTRGSLMQHTGRLQQLMRQESAMANDPNMEPSTPDPGPTDAHGRPEWWHHKYPGQDDGSGAANNGSSGNSVGGASAGADNGTSGGNG